MTEYNLQSEKIINNIEYPENSNIKPSRQICCKHNDKIYIIDGENGKIILFDPALKTFTKKISIPKIGRYPSAVVVFDRIYIFHGRDNVEEYLVYDINNNRIKSYKYITDKIHFVSALFYQNRIILFGGYNATQRKLHNNFKISGEMHKNHDGKINKWTINDKYKFETPVIFHSCLQYKHYVLVFGGSVQARAFTDSIYLLDLNNNDGWKELKHIKCPCPSHYIVTITEHNMVHLLMEYNKWPNWEDSKKAHYSLPISTILGSKFNNQEQETKNDNGKVAHQSYK